MKRSIGRDEIDGAVDRFHRIIGLMVGWAKEQKISTNEFAFVAAMLGGVYCGSKAKNKEEMERLVGILTSVLQKNARNTFRREQAAHKVKQ
jgi:hypothetical protein